MAAHAKTDKSDRLTMIARSMVYGKTVPQIAEELGMAPTELRDEIFAAHKAGEWAKAVRGV